MLVIANRELVLEQISMATKKLHYAFPLRFCAFIWSNITPVHSLLLSKEVEVREWSHKFLEACARISKYV